MSIAPGPAPPGRVLSTLNEDGSRRWIRPRPSAGVWWRRRRAVAYALMALFIALPYLRVGGKPSVLLDLPRREFTLLGTTFLATDTLLFMLLLVSAIIALFAFTALFGRVWCGWTCPQTVYMEFLFRPIERWLEGGRIGSMTLDEQRRPHPRRVLKWAIYAVLAMGLAHVFLAYFVGVDRLAVWVRRSPIEHPTSFLVMAVTAVAMFLDFAWFREQTCLVACPYGRLQSALLDRRSLIVGYDPGRGEPRLKGTRDRPARAGDCIDCGLCVITCPTGIDIRDGLQMECIHCTQCMDACDSVMVKIGKPPGLIRYSSRDQLEGRPARLVRPRVVLYPLALAVALGLLAFNLGTRTDAEITVLRSGGAPYLLGVDGAITNLIRVKVVNRGSLPREYRIALAGAPDLQLVMPAPVLRVAAGGTGTAMVFVVAPRGSMPSGTRDIALQVSDGARFDQAYAYRLIGPEPGDATERRERRRAPRRGAAMTPARLWPLAVVAVLAVTVGANVFLLVAAHGRDAAVVERDYYRRAVAFDSTLAAERRSDALGWRVAVELGRPDAGGSAPLRVQVTDRAGTPVDGAQVRVTAVHNRAAAHPVTAPLARVGIGAYAGTLPLGRRGLWELDLEATRGAERYLRRLSCDTGSRAAG